MSERYTETEIMKDDNRLSKIRIFANEWENNYDIGLVLPNDFTGGITKYVSSIEFSEVQLGFQIRPFISLHHDTMQSIFNQLWKLGFRPKDGTGNSGHMEAQKAHLEDMRKLVFNNNK